MIMQGSSKVNRYFLVESENEADRAKNRNSKYLKKQGKLDFGNPNDVWKFTYQRNMIKLAIFVLLYVFSKDDGEISDKEFNQIKKFYKKERKILTIEDQKEIYNHALKPTTYEELVKYMEENDFHERILAESVDVVRKLIFKENKYVEILNHLSKTYNK